MCVCVCVCVSSVCCVIVLKPSEISSTRDGVFYTAETWVVVVFRGLPTVGLLTGDLLVVKINAGGGYPF